MTLVGREAERARLQALIDDARAGRSGALLLLLARAAEERPVLAVIEDAQWLDEPSLEALLFVGRCLDAEVVAMLAALRDGTPVASMDVPWLERLPVRPLRDDDARSL